MRATILIIIKLVIFYKFAHKHFRLMIIFHLIMEILWKMECFFQLPVTDEGGQTRMNAKNAL